MAKTKSKSSRSRTGSRSGSGSRSKAKPLGFASDIIEQGIISARSIANFFRVTSRDKRTVKSTKTALKELEGGRRPKEVAADLGITYQRYTALKKQVTKGQAYSPELRDVFKQTKAQREEALRPGPERGPRKPGAGKEQAEPEIQRTPEGVYTFDNLEKIKATGTKVEEIKSFTSKRDALNWWKTINQSSKYIAIARHGKLWKVVGFGDRSQRPKTTRHKTRKGTIKEVRSIEDIRGENRVSQIIRKYKGE